MESHSQPATRRAVKCLFNGPAGKLIWPCSSSDDGFSESVASVTSADDTFDVETELNASSSSVICNSVSGSVDREAEHSLVLCSFPELNDSGSICIRTGSALTCGGPTSSSCGMFFIGMREWIMSAHCGLGMAGQSELLTINWPTWVFGGPRESLSVSSMEFKTLGELFREPGGQT